MVERCRDAFPIRIICHSLKVSPGGYYDWRDRPLNARAQDNERLLCRIRRLYVDSDDVLGNSLIRDGPRHEGEAAA